MNRIDRLTAILMQLQTRRLVRGQDIADRFGISLRTVYRDIRALEDAGVPIGAEAGMGYFLSPGYHLPPVMFSAEEARALLLGGKLVECFSDPHVNRSYACAMDKIKNVLGEHENQRLDALSSYIEVLKTTVQPDQAVKHTFLSDIQGVLGKNRVIRLTYTSGYKEEHTQRDVEPLGLCFYGAHWHLLAYCRLRQAYRDFRLDRINTVEATPASFDRQRHADLPTLISDTLHESEVQPACVRFDQKVISIVGDQKYYYGLVEEKKLDGQMEMHFLTSSYDYLSHWLIGFVDMVKVVSPESLKQSMAEHAARLYAYYCPPSS